MKGSGLDPDSTYTLWIQDNPVADQDPLETDEDPSEAQETVTTGPVNGNESGGFPATAIWTIPSDAQVTHHEYDLVADLQGDSGNTNIYNTASDGIDSATVAGIVAPVPEQSTTVLTGIGLTALVGYFLLRRYRRTREENA